MCAAVQRTQMEPLNVQIEQVYLDEQICSINATVNKQSINMWDTASWMEHSTVNPNNFGDMRGWAPFKTDAIDVYMF